MRLPPYAGTTKAGSLPSTGLVGRRQRYYEPLGLPPGTIPFRRRLVGTAFVQRGPPGRVSPVPYQAVWTCPPPYPVGVLHPFRVQDAVCCLRRGMSDSAYPSPFGFLSHEAARFTFRLGPPTGFPPRSLTASSGLSTSRLDEKLSLPTRDLLRGAPALTATGLSPASLIQHDSPKTNLSGRTMPRLYPRTKTPRQPKRRGQQNRAVVSRTYVRKVVAAWLAFQRWEFRSSSNRKAGRLRAWARRLRCLGTGRRRDDSGRGLVALPPEINHSE